MENIKKPQSSLIDNPIKFADFLKRTGWTELPSKREDVKIFQTNIHGEFYQINLPMNL